MVNSREDCNDGFEKVVVHCEDRMIKGYLENRPEHTLDALLQNATTPNPSILRIRPVNQDTVLEIPIHRAKAVFFVRDFEGNPQRKQLRFYRGSPIVHGVWVRLEFNDGEVMEGLVHNTIHFLRDSGFFMRPSDPYSNNLLVYVMKNWLKECRVLGLRNIKLS